MIGARKLWCWRALAGLLFGLAVYGFICGTADIGRYLGGYP